MGTHIAPARTLTLTGKYQRVIFAIVVDAQLQIETYRSYGDGLPYIFHLTSVI